MPRYTPFNGDNVSDFHPPDYVLRPILFSKPRETELLLSISIPNMGALGSETSAKQAASFGRTMRSVVQTMQHLSDENNFREQPPWGKDSWKRVVVLVVTDGVVVGDDTLSVLKKMGVYFQRGDFKVIPRDGETEYPVYDDGNSSPLLIKGKLVRARIYEVCLPSLP